MFNIAAHIALALGLFWYQRRLKYKPSFLVLTVFWYGAGSLLIYIESAIMTGTAFSGLFLQGMLIELFYVLPMYFSLRWAKKHHHDIIHPFFMFLVFSAVATLIVGWLLANADIAQGLTSIGL